MLGLGDASTAAALILCVAVTLFGVVYGIVNWNSGGPDDLAPERPKRRRRRRRCHRGGKPQK